MSSSRPLAFLAPLAALAAGSMVALAPATAWAQGGQGGAQGGSADCPPGSWFCDGGGQQAQPTPAGSGQLQQLPPPASGGAAPAAAQTPPVVVYQPPPVVVQPRDAPPPYVYAPKEPKQKHEWGLNLHLGGAMMGRGSAGDAGMGLLGVGLRFRPLPFFALDGNLDFAGGRDYEGNRRGETAMTGNAIFFFNPKNRFQVYGLGGMGLSFAHVDYRTNALRSIDVQRGYAYLGLQTGLGFEFRASKAVALNLDVKGFLRTRVDPNVLTTSEYVDANGRGTNTSGGGILTAGITFYF